MRQESTLRDAHLVHIWYMNFCVALMCCCTAKSAAVYIARCMNTSVDTEPRASQLQAPSTQRASCSLSSLWDARSVSGGSRDASTGFDALKFAIEFFYKHAKAQA